MVSPSKDHLEEHYADLSDKPFFKGLVTCELLLHLDFLEADYARHAKRSHRRHGLGGP
jgi:hypothetical protein